MEAIIFRKIFSVNNEFLQKIIYFFKILIGIYKYLLWLETVILLTTKNELIHSRQVFLGKFYGKKDNNIARGVVGVLFSKNIMTSA